MADARRGRGHARAGRPLRRRQRRPDFAGCAARARRRARGRARPGVVGRARRRRPRRPAGAAHPRRRPAARGRSGAACGPRRRAEDGVRADDPARRLPGARHAARGRGGARGVRRRRDRVSVPPAPPLLLASTSPQRRAILEQLGLPFDVVAPEYEELGDNPIEHALGKARSVDGGDRPVVGVDTVVLCEGAVLGKPAHEGEAEEMLELPSGRTHEVVSGLCLRTPAWEELRMEKTLVTFRALTARDLAAYLAGGEWEGRAGGYAIQGRGAALVERVEGDYLNVVGLPAATLVALLAERFPGLYGFG